MLAAKLILAFLAFAAASDDSLFGQKVYRITPETEDQVHFLKEWFAFLDVDLWTEPSAVGHNVDVRVPVHLMADFEDKIKLEGLNYEVLIQDVGNAVQAQETSNHANAFASGFNYQRFNRYDKIVDELRYLESTYSSATTFTVGRTYEQREMVGLKIGSGNKAAIWIDGGIHAREWISPATVMYFIRKLLTSNEPRITRMLALYNFYFLPVFNADGYEYTFTKNRMWRKTRSGRGRCKGADPNRNWDHKFGGAGTSGYTCSDIYHGPKAFSEIEVKNVATYLKSIKNLKSYYNVHAYSQLVLTPWSYTSSLPSDYSEIARVAKAFTVAVSQRYGTQYRYGPPPKLLYAVAGGSIDWTYAVLGVKYSYALELRDKGRYGFLLPANQIAPTGEETSDGFIAAIAAMSQAIKP